MTVNDATFAGTARTGAFSRWIGTTFALAICAAPSTGVAKAQMFKQPDAPALKAWFAQRGSASFALWSRDPWAPILQNPAGETVPAPKPTPITLRTLGGGTAYACAVVTSEVETPLDLQLPPSVVLKARNGASVRAEVMAVGYLKSRNFGEAAAPMFSAPQLQAIRAEHALPKEQQKLSFVASVPQQVLNWTTIKDFPILHLRPYESVALWLSSIPKAPRRAAIREKCRRWISHHKAAIREAVAGPIGCSD